MVPGTHEGMGTMANKRADPDELAARTTVGSASRLGASRHRKRKGGDAKPARISLFWTAVLFVAVLVAVLVIALEFSR